MCRLALLLLAQLQLCEGALLQRESLSRSASSKSLGASGVHDAPGEVPLKAGWPRLLSFLGLGGSYNGTWKLNINVTALADILAEFVGTREPEDVLSEGKLRELEKLEERATGNIKRLEDLEVAQADQLESVQKKIDAAQERLNELPEDSKDPSVLRERAALKANIAAWEDQSDKLRATLRDIAKEKAEVLADLKDVARLRSGDVDKAVRSSEKNFDKAIKDLESGGNLPPAYKEMGVKVNSADDWFAFLVALGTNIAVLSACVIVFSFLRPRFRLVYSRNNWSNWGSSDPEERAHIEDGVATYAVDRTFPLHNAWGRLPDRLEGTFFDWLHGSVGLHTKEVISACGLDQAMLIEFANMGIVVFSGLALPCMCILAPLHIWAGGHAAGRDYLSWQGFSNVEQGSWLCWVHAFFVWYVVLFVDGRIYKYQAKFVPLRTEWLKKLSHTESCTILVENIPLKYRTPNRIRNYMNEMFGGRQVVDEVHLLPHTDELEKAIAVRDKAKLAHEHAMSQARGIMEQTISGTNQELALGYSEAQAEVVAERFRLHKRFEKIERQAEAEVFEEEQEEEEEPDDVERQPLPPSATGDGCTPGPAAATSSDVAEQMKPQESAAIMIQTKWRRKMSGAGTDIMKGFKSNLGVMDMQNHMRSHFGEKLGVMLSPLETMIVETYSSAAFVTFTTRYDAIMARRLVPYKADRSLFVVSEAPDPSDVCYANLKKDSLHWKTWNWVGIGLISGVFLMFLPTIAFISSSSNLNNIALYSPEVKEWVKTHTKLAGMWNGLAGALGLNIVLGFLPTLLMLISQVCFKQSGKSRTQHQLQKLYFLFLVVFQLLVVSIANSMMHAIVAFVHNPLSLVERLSDGMCKTTHFYLNIFVLQWATFGMEFTRYVTLVKYLLWKRMYSSVHEAIEASEPEDQDYYGLGARSARCASLFVIGIAFVALCPLMSVLGLISFTLIRMFYGYQVVYAETRKPDIGGQFFVTSLKHCQWGLIIFVLCMVGVLLERASTRVPACVAGLALVYMLESIYVFDHKFFWESICHEEVMQAQREEERHTERHEAQDAHPATRDTYVQSELLDDSHAHHHVGSQF